MADSSPRRRSEAVEAAIADLVEAAWRLVVAYRATKRAEEDDAAEPWLHFAVESGGAVYAWWAVDMAWARDDHRAAVWWTARANGLQGADADDGIEIAPDLFAPFPDVERGGIRSDDASVQIVAEDRDAATTALAAARKRLGLVNAVGREYADEDEAYEHLATFTPGDGDWEAYTVNFVSAVEQHDRGPWVWMDAKGGLVGPMAGGMLRVVLEEARRAGLTQARMGPGPWRSGPDA